MSNYDILEIWRLIISLIFIYILNKYMHIFFISRDTSSIKKVIIWTIFYLAEYYIGEMIETPIFIIIFNIICCTLICMVLFNGNFKEKLIWIIAINVIGMMIEIVIGSIYLLLNIDYGSSIYDEMLGSTISKIILFMLVMSCEKLLNTKSKKYFSSKYWYIIFTIPVGSIFILNVIFTLNKFNVDKFNIYQLFISCFIILFFNLSTFYIYDKLSDEVEHQKLNIVLEKQVEAYKNHLMIKKEQEINLKEIKHNIQNHIICIREYINQEKIDELKLYIDILYEENYIDKYKYINSGNITIDALLNYKLIQIQKYNIKMTTHLNIPYDLDINNVDMCIILGNALDNAIEAVYNINDIEKREISISIIYKHGNLFINISNPFVGDLKKDVKGNLLTTNRDRLNHGMGFLSIKKIIKKYNGLITVEDVNQIFILKILLYF